MQWCAYSPPADGSYCEHGREVFDEEVEEEGGKGKDRAAVKKPVSCTGPVPCPVRGEEVGVSV